MKKFTIVLAVLIFIVPSVSFAADLTSTQVQAILSLLSAFGADSATVANVQAALNGQPVTSTNSGTSSSPSCISITYDLYSGTTDATTNGQVSQLQQFLGVITTGYFGPMTLQAVQNWQSSHGIISSGSSDTTGYGFVGPKTRSALAQGCNNNSNNQTSANIPTSSSYTNSCNGSQYPMCNSGYSFICPASGVGYCFANGISTGSTVPPSSTVTPSIGYSTYTPLTFSQYQNNSASYIGQNIIVTGMQDSFIPSTSATGSTNFVETENPFDLSQPKIELEIPNVTSYTATVNALQNQSSPILQFVRAYGTGMVSQSFVQSSLFGKTTVSIPTVLVTRLDQCLHGSMQTTVLTGTSFESNFSCSQWSTIFPAGIAQPIQPAPTCTLTASPTSITSGQSSTLTWSSTNATSGTITNGGSGTSGTQVVNPTQTTTFTGTFPGPGGTAQCSATVVVTQSSQPAPITPTISVSNSPVVYNGTPQTATITSSIPGSIVSIEYNGSPNAPTMPGTYAVTALFAPTTNPNNYSSRLSAGNFIINAGNSAISPVNQTISFGSLQNVTYGIVGFTITAQASSGLGVNFTAQGNCTVTNAGTTISTGLGTASVYITGVGSCTVTAHQPGNAYYSVAPDVSQTFTINPSSTSPVLGSDATLKSLTVNGASVTGFSSGTNTYSVTLPVGTLQAPTVAAVSNDTNATDAISQAANSLGTATVVVTAQNGTTKNTYTLNFRPSDAGQCNFNGNIFYCESNPSITVSPLSLPNATVGTNYNQSVAISDPDTSSQNFRWNIISGIFPPGLGFAFSPTMAFECSGTYCFFTSPPSSVTVPANTPGIFFGTPTTAGTYTFTLQAIDNMNYVALPTFTITIANATSSE